MPTEAELRRRMLAEDATPIDAATIVRLARRRRLPRRIALGTTVSLAVVGIGVAGVSGIRGVGPMSASDSAGGSAEESAADDQYGAPAPASLPDLCGGVFPAEAASPSGVELATSFPDTVADGTDVIGVVTLRNTTDARIVATAAAPTIVIVSDGVVVGFGNDRRLDESIPVDLPPGGTQQFETESAAVSCGGDSAALEPGTYGLGGVIGLERDPAASDAGAPEQLSSPVEPITVG